MLEAIHRWRFVSTLRIFLGRISGFNPDRHPRYTRLTKIPSVATIIDVGVGDQGTPFLYSAFPEAFFVSIDPLIEAARAVGQLLPESRSFFVQTAVGSEESEVSFHVSSKPSRTSLLRRVKDDASSASVEKRMTRIRRLDDVTQEAESSLGSLKQPLMLKVDIEGYELECLVGATRTISQASYVLVEAPLTENFENSYRFSDLIGLMANNNFEVFQILKAGNNSIDLLFARADSPIRRMWTYGNTEIIERVASTATN